MTNIIPLILFSTRRKRKMKKRLIVLTGAGISAESGLQTFRDADGLWEGYDVYEVATPEAWRKNPVLVQNFYNMRRKAVLEAQPNAAHIALTELEKKFSVTIITQNIDDLHERAGSSDVIHLHGIITKAQSVAGSTVDNAGRVEFNDAVSGTGTELDIELNYFPPAGSLGQGIAKLFNGYFEDMVREDITSFKHFVEGEEYQRYSSTSGSGI